MSKKLTAEQALEETKKSIEAITDRQYKEAKEEIQTAIEDGYFFTTYEDETANLEITRATILRLRQDGFTVEMTDGRKAIEISWSMDQF